MLVETTSRKDKIMVPTVTVVEPMEVMEPKPTHELAKIKERARNWTDMEVNLFAAILVDETYNFALQLENLATKKSSNKEVLTNIKVVFDQALEESEFKGTALNKYFPGEDGFDNFEPLDTAPEKLRKKYNNLKAEWRKQTERGTVSLHREPRWFSLLNNIFMASTDPSSMSSNISNSSLSPPCMPSPLYRRRPRGGAHKRNYDVKPMKMERFSPPAYVGGVYEERDEIIEADRRKENNGFTPDNLKYPQKPSNLPPALSTFSHSRIDSRTMDEKKFVMYRKYEGLQPPPSIRRKAKYGRSGREFGCSPHRMRKVRTCSTDISSLACGVKDLANSLLQIKQLSVENERRRDETLLRFFTEEGERNRAHELRLAEIYTRGWSVDRDSETHIPSNRGGEENVDRVLYPKLRCRSSAMLLNCVAGRRGVPHTTIAAESKDALHDYSSSDMTIDKLYPAPHEGDE